MSNTDISDSEAREMAIAFGDPDKFKKAKERIKKATEKNERFYDDELDSEESILEILAE